MAETTSPQAPITDRLEKLFFQALDMLDRQAQDRRTLVKEKDEIGKLVQMLIKQTKEVGQYEAGIRKRIQDEIHQSSEAAFERAMIAIIENNNKALEKTINKLNDICKKTEVMIEGHRNEKMQSFWCMLAMVLASSALTGFFVVWFLA